MTRITVEKCDGDLDVRSRRDLHKVADAHAQQLAIEVQAPVKIIDPDHKMAEPQCAGFET